MYCPQCGQQQASTEMRFCSRCGFPLAGVVELLASGGVPGSQAEPQGQQMSPRRKGVKQGVMMMIVGTVLVPILAILNSAYHGPNIFDVLVPLAAVICFAGGLMRILYATLFEQGAPSAKQDAYAYASPPTMPAQLNTGARISALPPQRSTPVSDLMPPRANTAELVPPPSVTENTTRLLDEDKVK
ncbi:MAG TPA: hypothetical protein VF779_01565 [Pyrinomonadaceae bacterium]